MSVWIRRGYGSFVRCANEVKARGLAKHWYRKGQGDTEKHPVIGLFVGRGKYPHEATRTVLYS